MPPNLLNSNMKLHEVLRDLPQEELFTTITRDFKNLPNSIQKKILAHYKIINIQSCAFLSYNKLQDILHDIEYYSTESSGTDIEQRYEPIRLHPADWTAKQAGSLPSDTQYPSRFFRRQGG